MASSSMMWPSLDTDAAICAKLHFAFMNAEFSDCTLRVYCTSKRLQVSPQLMFGGISSFHVPPDYVRRLQVSFRRVPLAEPLARQGEAHASLLFLH